MSRPISATSETRTQLSSLARLHRIAATMSAQRRVTVGQLARSEECSRKTITRCLAFFEGSLGWEIRRDPRGIVLVKGGTLIAYP